MNEYISKKYLEELLDYYLNSSNGAERYGYNIIKGELITAPAADVVEVVHGQWKLYPSSMHRRCSVCKIEYDRPKFNVRANYCPNCGADMRSNENE